MEEEDEREAVGEAVCVSGGERKLFLRHMSFYLIDIFLFVGNAASFVCRKSCSYKNRFICL